MKRRPFTFVLVAMLLAALCACAQKTEADSQKNQPYTVNCNGVSYTVTPENNNSGSISDGENIYHYVYEAAGSGYAVTFTYPDGESSTWRQDENVGYGSTSLNFDFSKYPDGMELQSVLERGNSSKPKKTEKNVGLILLLLVIGAINTACPKAAWYLEMGWKLKDAEPSEAALGANRVAGVLALVVGVILTLA